MVALADIEIVVVTYYSRALVESLMARLPRDLPVAVVDNACGADAVQEALADRAHARYLEGGGVGFARAANLGARTSTRPYVVFVNPDTAPTLELFQQLVEDLASDPTLGAVSAMTVSSNGRVELGVGGWEPTLSRVLMHATGIYRWFPLAGLYARPAPYRPIDLGWLTGACLAVPRETFLSLGGFDEHYFLYNEDMAYGRRLREAGLQQRLRTDLLVPHDSGGSGGGRTTMRQMQGASMYAYVRQHNSALAAEAMRAVLSVGSVSRWLVMRARRDEAAARSFAAYNRGLWRGAPEFG